MNFKPGPSQQGTTFIEMMVALLVLAVGLLGFVGLMMAGLTTYQQAFYRSQANRIAANMVESARANSVGLQHYAMSSADGYSSNAPNCLVRNCTPSEIAVWDKAQWISRVVQWLPEYAQITITVDQTVFDMLVELQYHHKNRRGAKRHNEQALVVLRATL